MTTETIKITVCSGSQRCERIETITTDGSFRAVEAAFNRIVNRGWPIGTVTSAVWKYNK